MIGAEFEMTDWPLHITLADVFAIDRDNTNIDTKISEALLNQPVFTITARKQTKLGNTDVVLIEKTNELTKLHTLLIDLLESNGAVFNTPTFTRNGFLPHCTIQKSARLQQGEIHEASEVAVIDMFPNGDWKRRKVFNTFKLGNNYTAR
jgi:2'-5' RNA ligase